MHDLGLLGFGPFQWWIGSNRSLTTRAGESRDSPRPGRFRPRLPPSTLRHRNHIPYGDVGVCLARGRCDKTWYTVPLRGLNPAKGSRWCGGRACTVATVHGGVSERCI